MRSSLCLCPRCFAMASNQQRREAKTQPNLNKLRGEGTSKSKGGEMSAASKEIIANIKDKDPLEKWLFTQEQQENTPSRRDNVTAEKELNYRQQAANLIQDMGQKLPVNQLTINTAIVYMHRFYMFHSFQAFSRFIMAPTALFLAAKVEEQPRKLEHVIKVCHSCLHADKPHLDVHSDAYLKQAQELVQNELIMLQTLGFDISIDHPHTYVVKCTQLVKASRDLSQMAYFMATNSLHLTTFCLKYKPTVVSAMCIHLSCKWSNYEIPLSSTGRAYWTYMDPTITEAALEDIINEFLQILNQCPTRLRKLKNYKPSQRDGPGGSTPKSKDTQQHKQPSIKASSSEASFAPPQGAPSRPSLNPSEMQKKHPSMTIAEYKHKREKEQMQTKPTKEADKQLPGKPPPPHPGQRNPAYPSSRSGVPVKPGQPPVPRPPQKAPPSTHMRPPPSGGPSTIHHAKQERPPQKPSGAPDHQKRPEKMPPHAKPGHPHPGAHLTHKPRTKDSHPQGYTQRPPPTNLGTTIKQEKGKPEGGGAPGPNNPPAPEDDMKNMEMKLMEQMKAEKTAVNPTKQAEGTHHETKHQTPQPNHHHHHQKATSKEAKSRHSLPSNFHLQDTQGNPPSQETKLSLYEQYKKNPDALRHSLKKKMQTEPLNEEEKLLLHKLKKKDEERQKKKREHRKQKQHSKPESANVSADATDSLSPSSGPLTVRIKLPAAVRAEMSMAGATGGSPGSKVMGSSSGSGSEAPTSSPGHISKHGRKRAHGHDGSGQSDPTSAKLSRKSEGHPHHQSHHGSHDKNRRHHGRPNLHHHQSKSHQPAGQKIDEALFQRALVDAVSMVQSAQGGPSTSETSTPTATLKQHGQNGDHHHPPKHEKRRSSSKRNKYSGFDPTAPISNTPPENLFEAEEDSAATNHRSSQAAELSSPETGEIRDDDDDDNLSPFHDHVTSRSTAQAKDRYHAQWRTNANSTNHPSLHYHHMHPPNGSVPPPPIHPHSSRSGMYPQTDSYERLPPPPPLTGKPRTVDQR